MPIIVLDDRHQPDEGRNEGRSLKGEESQNQAQWKDSALSRNAECLREQSRPGGERLLRGYLSVHRRTRDRQSGSGKVLQGQEWGRISLPIGEAEGLR